MKRRWLGVLLVLVGSGCGGDKDDPSVHLKLGSGATVVAPGDGIVVAPVELAVGKGGIAVGAKVLVGVDPDESNATDRMVSIMARPADMRFGKVDPDSGEMGEGMLIRRDYLRPDTH